MQFCGRLDGSARWWFGGCQGSAQCQSSCRLRCWESQVCNVFLFFPWLFFWFIAPVANAGYFVRNLIAMFSFFPPRIWVWNRFFGFFVFWLVAPVEATVLLKISGVRCDSVMCVTWLIHTCDMSLSACRLMKWLRSCVTWLIHTWEMTHSYGWHGTAPLSLCQHIQHRHSVGMPAYEITHVTGIPWHDSFTRVAWLIHTCDMTPSAWRLMKRLRCPIYE